MIMATTDFTQYLKGLFPSIKFYTGTINRTDDMCVGVFAKGRSGASQIALGGLQNTSSNTLTLTLLVHWTENAATCEGIANSIYDRLLGSKDFIIGGRRIVYIDMLDSCPVDVERDERNIVEMVIRLNIIYER